MSEILAPCGGYESLTAALNAGADAVYAGMKSFSARKNAENFSDEELLEACRECHRRGAKLYLALNTLVYDGELAEFARCVETAAKYGVDGVIVQDIGAARLARRLCPELPLHASTQMTLNSVSGVRAAQALGFVRVVIGRELSLEQIRRIRSRTDAELELFVHGALCVCVSGQCYMSSIFGGRSGNRGLCAQPCRLDFGFGGRHGVISLKDSSLVPHLRELEALGIESFKIEGRMKRPEYAACAADACRRSLAGEEYDAQRLSDIFSRGGLTDGYFTGDMRDMQGTRGKEDVQRSSAALSGIKALYKDVRQTLRADVRTTIKTGLPISARAECCGVTVQAQGELPQIAQSAPATAQSVRGRMAKLGGTQFYAGDVTADVDDGLFVPAAALNALRRQLCERLDEAVTERNTPRYTLSGEIPQAAGTRAADAPEKAPELRAEVATAEQLKQALELPFGLAYAPLTLLSEDTPCKDRVAVLPPFVLSDCEDEVRGQLMRLRRAGFTKGAAMTLAHAQLLKECGYAVHGGYRMNIANSLSAGVCAELGFADVTLSFECTIAQLSALKSPIPCGVVAYGRLPLMVMRRCPAADGAPRGLAFTDGSGTPCGACARKEPCGASLTDRRGNEMPLLCGGNSVELLNPDTLIMSDRMRDLRGFDFAVLRFTNESGLKSVYDMYAGGGKPSGSLTRGLYYRGAE